MVFQKIAAKAAIGYSSKIIYMYIYDIYFAQFYNNINIKGQHFSFYGDSWPWVC